MTWNTFFSDLFANGALVLILAFVGRTLVQQLMSRDVEGFKARLQREAERGRLENEKEIERLRGELRLLTIRAEAKISQLHVKRAETVEEVYLHVRELADEVSSVVENYDHMPRLDFTEDKDLWEGIRALQGFMGKYNKKKLYLSRRIDDMIGELVSLYFEAFTGLHEAKKTDFNALLMLYGQLNEEGGDEAERKKQEWEAKMESASQQRQAALEKARKQADDTLEELASEFRELLGLHLLDDRQD